ncbi:MULTISPECIES: hypothetical protein [unclassified Streptomyces]|uniref:hypothetical protein n=1 Tax=unclassified Streptomyces TaxID=2593676 RepID=UPI0021CCC40A|nr:hypothetical protein [Streptomyces sp. sk2.1]
MPTTTPPAGSSATEAPPISGSPSGSASSPRSPASPSSSSSTSGADSETTSGKGSSPPDAQSPLAGREAGEGRLRPGRQFSPWELAHADGLLDPPEEQTPAIDPEPIPVTTPTETAPTGTEPAPRQALDAPTVSQVKQVSLGAGIALIGTGLAFLAFRMRRSN